MGLLRRASRASRVRRSLAPSRTVTGRAPALGCAARRARGARARRGRPLRSLAMASMMIAMRRLMRGRALSGVASSAARGCAVLVRARRSATTPIPALLTLALSGAAATRTSLTGLIVRAGHANCPAPLRRARRSAAILTGVPLLSPATPPCSICSTALLRRSAMAAPRLTPTAATRASILRPILTIAARAGTLAAPAIRASLRIA